MTLWGHPPKRVLKIPRAKNENEHRSSSRCHSGARSRRAALARSRAAMLSLLARDKKIL
jgi:hypothetical protein